MSELNSRSKVGRELALKRQYNLYKKSHSTAYIYWLFLGGLGLHRLYVKDILYAGLLALGTVFIIIYMYISPDNPPAFTQLFIPAWMILMIVEAIWIPFRVNKKNKEILKCLKEKHDLA